MGGEGGHNVMESSLRFFMRHSNGFVFVRVLIGWRSRAGDVGWAIGTRHPRKTRPFFIQAQVNL